MLKAATLFVLLSVSLANGAERKLTGPGITVLLTDKTYQQILPTTNYRIEQTFRNTGNTHFVVDGQVQQGLWRVTGDQYCSNWLPSEHWDCYEIFAAGQEIVFLSARGARYVFVTPMP